MGFRAPEEVPSTFLVTDAPGIVAARSPQVGVSFDGRRRDISVQDLIDAVGRRRPDWTLAQRQFRFAFLLVVPADSMPSADQLAQVEKYRSLFTDFYQQAASGRASAETTLQRALHLSAFPATGLVNGSMIAVSLSLDAPAPAPVIVELDSESGVSLPPYATIPAGATRANFFMMGLLPGVAGMIARPVDSRYETAIARIQVADASSLRAQVVSNGPRALVLRVTDGNNLAYPSVVVRVTSTNGTLDSPVEISDATGTVRFLWTEATGPATTLLVSINGATPIPVSL